MGQRVDDIGAAADDLRGRLPSLDGWRALAVILVLVSHTAYADAAPVMFEALIPVGDLGVRAFFVLSGFLITFLLLQEARRQNGISLPQFYMRRAIRILPPYAAYVAVLGGLSWAGLYSDSPSSWLGVLTFTRNVVGRGASATVHFWSLAIEEQFYLVWPGAIVILGLWKRRKTMAVLLVALVVAAVFFRWQLTSASFGGSLLNRLRSPKSALAYMDSLAVGCLGACAAVHYGRRSLSNAWGRIGIGLAFIVIVVGEIVLRGHVRTLVAALVPAVQALSFMTLFWITAFQPTGIVAQALNSRPLTLLGRWSYSLYVWQFLMLPSFMHASAGHWFQHWTVWWTGALALALSSYYGLERPALRLRQHLHWLRAGQLRSGEVPGHTTLGL
jgi:peptidoglycan/LPS O-acetylase OafA/YrhL